MSNMMVRIWRKPETQAFIRSLRQAGYEVQGDGYKYECWYGDDLVFCALIGSRNYMCRINRAYVTERDTVPSVV